MYPPTAAMPDARPTLRVHYSDFWRTFRPQEFWLHRILSKDFTLVLDAANPELLVFSDYGIDHLEHKCLKIYYSHENKDANRLLCDYSFCFHGKGDGHQFFSNIAEDEFFEDLLFNRADGKLKDWRNTPKTKFCNFVYSNPRPRERIAFCQQLMRYQRVDCPGKVLNNHPPFDAHGYRYEKKYEFLSAYKFTIAFENESTTNYTTEKILHPLLVGSIPIYWGNPAVRELINPECFVNCHDYDTFDAVIERVKQIDRDDDLFRAYTSAAPILPSSPLATLTEEFLRTRLNAILLTRRTVSNRPVFPILRRYYWLEYKARNRVVYTLQQLEQLLHPKASF
jgi:alpha(1,3/1,4) fucosyltransferase